MNMIKRVFVLHAVDGWDRVVDAILPKLKPGTIIALSGPLGAGKTTFVQHLARRLGAHRPVVSPTFALMRAYKLHPANKKLSRLIHVDAYRLNNIRDMQTLNLDEELREPGAIMAIEWPQNVKRWLQKKKSVWLKIKLHKNNRTAMIRTSPSIDS